MAAPDETGEAGFLAGLRRCAREFEKRDGIIVFEVVPTAGRRRGQPVETGVKAEELQAWPNAPPHWVHLPGSVTFGRTNARPSPIAGWQMHSRNVARWGNAKEPVQGWIAHVRAVLEEAR
jgi:hypothetical protein